MPRDSGSGKELNPQAQIVSAVSSWYQNLPKYGGFPAKGTVSGALVLLERLKKSLDLDLQAHTAKGGAQIKGASGASVRRILEAFRETRPFVSEGGRTNRGLPNAMKSLLGCLEKTGLSRLPIEGRSAALRAGQEFLVERVREFHGRQRLKLVFDPAKTTVEMVRAILAAARENGKEGPVAQYLVGAKLQLRYPTVPIENRSFSSADQPKGRKGDFVIADAAFHVTVAPMAPVYEKCRANLDEGLKPYLLVPERTLEGARQNSDLLAPGRVTVAAVEHFVAQNVDEIAGFSRPGLERELRRLLETYNERVDAAEIDKSMLIDIPQNL